MIYDLVFINNADYLYYRKIHLSMHILIMHAMCIITVIIIASLASIVPTLHTELKSWEEPGDEAIEV